MAFHPLWGWLAKRGGAGSRRDPERAIEIPADFGALLKSDPDAAKREVLRVREEFLQALSDGLVCRAFERNDEQPRYLFFR